MLNVGVNLTGTQRVRSAAEVRVVAESRASAFSFTDSIFKSRVGLYGSAYIADVSAPANNYNSTPDGKVSNTGASVKMLRGPGGSSSLLLYQAHNLFANPTAPANQSITVVVGISYTVVITGTVTTTASGAASGTWTSGETVFTAATTTLTLGSTSGVGTVHIRRTLSDPTFVGGAAAIVAIPYEFDLAGNCLGSPHEESRANLFLNSEAFGSWSATNTTVTADQIRAPSGQLTADLITAGASGDTLAQNATVSSGATIAYSKWMKRGTHDWVRMTIFNGSNQVVGWYNLSTGVVGTVSTGGTGTAASGYVEPYADGWYRCVLVGALTGVTTYTCLTASAAADNSFTRVASGQRYQWGAQAEVGTYATSYIQTFGASLTRNADAQSIATSSLAYSSTAGALVVEATTAVGSGTQVVAQLDDGTENERFRIVRDSSNNIRFIVTDGGVEQANLNLGTVPASTTFKIAVAWAQNDVAASLNGGEVSRDTVATLPTVTTLRFGRSFTGEHLNGRVRSTLHFASRLSDADLRLRSAA